MTNHEAKILLFDIAGRIESQKSQRCNKLHATLSLESCAARHLKSKRQRHVMLTDKSRSPGFGNLACAPCALCPIGAANAGKHLEYDAEPGVSANKFSV